MNFIVRLELNDNLSEEEIAFINNKISELKNIFGIEQEGNLFFKKNKKLYDDFGPCNSFFIKINKFKRYFKIIEYDNLLQGVRHGTI